MNDYEAEMRDAGRGHLLASTPTWNDRADHERKAAKESGSFFMCPKHGPQRFSRCFCLRLCDDWSKGSE